MLTYSPKLGKSHKFTVGSYSSPPPAKKQKPAASLHLDIAVSGGMDVDDQEPNNPNETIDITDSSQEDPEAKDDSKHDAPDEDDDDEPDDHAKDKDYEPSKGRRGPHNK